MSNLEKQSPPSADKQPVQKGLGRGLGSLFGAELSKIEFKEEAASVKTSEVGTPAVAAQELKQQPIKTDVKMPEQNTTPTSQTEPTTEALTTAVPPSPSVAMPTSAQVNSSAAAVSTPALNIPDALVSNVEVPEESRIWNIPIEKIKINNYQPRKNFEKDKIQELANSIKEQGILQPIVARKTIKGDFEIVAGERRWRAAQLAGLHEVPVILKDIDDQKSLELALIENIQRENLNAIEEGEAYERLAKEFYLTQQEISQKVGKDRSTITNTLRLLSLAPEVKNMVISGELSTGHAKALLAITDPVKQREVAKKIASEKLTVRAAEKLAKSATRSKEDASKGDEVTDQLVSLMGEDLQKALATKVKIEYAKGIGKINIFFYSDSELTQISERLKKSWNPSKETT